MRNLFECGGLHQMEIVVGYLDKIPEFEFDGPETLKNFYIRHLFNIFAIREEQEELPNWILNAEDYIHKSEIMIAVNLLYKIASFKSLSIPNETIRQSFRIRSKSELNESLKELEDIDNKYLQIFKSLAEINLFLQSLCKKRHLDFELLSYQMSYEKRKKIPQQDSSFENN